MSTQKINGNLDLQSIGKVIGLIAGASAGDAVEYNQLISLLNNKQDNLTGGAGIKFDGNTVLIDLSTSAVDNSILTISGANNVVLNGNYTRASYEAYLEYLPSTDGDFNLRYGGDFAFFYKDNGNGTWSVVGAGDTDGTANSNNQWYGVVTSINPTTVTGDVLNYIVDSEGGGGIQDQFTNSHDLDENGQRVPTASDSNITYGAGSSDSYLAFDNGKLKVEVVTDTNNASTTNLLAASTIVTAISEAEARAKVAANTSFSNSVANIDGNPTNVQAMGEALEAEIDSVESDVQGLATTQSTLTSRQSALAEVIGVTLGTTELPAFSSPTNVFLNSTVVDDLTITVSGASDSKYDVTYERVNEGYADSNTDFVSGGNVGLFAYNAGGGTWYQLFRNPVGNNWILNTITTDPSTFTSGSDMSGSGSELAASSSTYPDVTVNGYVVPSTSAPLIESHNDVTSSVAPTDVMEALEGAAQNISGVYTNIGGLLGLGFGDADFGDGFTILPNDEDAKTLFQAIETELQALASGAGATWEAGVVQVVETSNISDLSNPGTDTFNGEALSQGDVLLLAGQTAQSQNGFYVFDTSSTALVRWSEADASGDFIQNRSVQIVNDGTEWAYKGVADPVVDTNVLPFEKIRDSITPDLSISRNKLAADVTTELDGKTDKYGAVVNLVADTWVSVTHNLGTLYVSPAFVNNSTNISESYTYRTDNMNQISIYSNQTESVRVTITG